MVSTDISQLAAECNTWRANLRNYRDEFSQFTNRLQEFASRQSDKNVLQEVERYHNQFQIQLINIHDLKHNIKEHERMTDWELRTGQGISDGSWVKHEELYEKYQHLDHMLQELKDKFSQFIKSPN